MKTLREYLRLFMFRWFGNDPKLPSSDTLDVAVVAPWLHFAWHKKKAHPVLAMIARGGIWCDTTGSPLANQDELRHPNGEELRAWRFDYNTNSFSRP